MAADVMNLPEGYAGKIADELRRSGFNGLVYQNSTNAVADIGGVLVPPRCIVIFEDEVVRADGIEPPTSAV